MRSMNNNNHTNLALDEASLSSDATLGVQETFTPDQNLAASGFTLDASANDGSFGSAVMAEHRILFRELQELNDAGVDQFLNAYSNYKTSYNKDDLYASPIFVGLANKSNSALVDIIFYQIELTGRKGTGLTAQGVVSPRRRKGSIAGFGEMDDDEQKAAANRRMWDEFLERMAQLDQLYYSTINMLDEAENILDIKIEAFKEEIENTDNEQKRIQLQIKKDQLKEQRAQIRAQRERLQENEVLHEETLEDIQENTRNVIASARNRAAHLSQNVRARMQANIQNIQNSVSSRFGRSNFTGNQNGSNSGSNTGDSGNGNAGSAQDEAPPPPPPIG